MSPPRDAEALIARTDRTEYHAELPELQVVTITLGGDRTDGISGIVSCRRHYRGANLMSEAGQIRVLIVDDDPLLRAVLAKLQLDNRVQIALLVQDAEPV